MNLCEDCGSEIQYSNKYDTYYCEASRLANNGKLSFGGDKTPELKEMCDTAHKKLREIEEAYEKEDEEMMIRLIKIRESLWT